MEERRGGDVCDSRHHMALAHNVEVVPYHEQMSSRGITGVNQLLGENMLILDRSLGIPFTVSGHMILFARSLSVPCVLLVAH